MDANYKRHGKKTDQETQSPVIKIFQDMMQREKIDKENSNLLKEKQDGKRRPYSGSRMKSEHHKQRAHDSSSSDRQKKQNIDNEDNKSREYINYRAQTFPFQNEKKENWWFWGGEAERKRSEDTCSCVSCALKKIISSEYTCMVCLSILFLLSVLAAFMLVFKTVPIAETAEKLEPAKKIKYPNSNEAKKDSSPGGYNDVGRLSDQFDDRQTWSDIASGHLRGLSGMTGYTDDINRDWASDEVGLRSEGLASSVLDTAKLNEGGDNEKLKNFYKKLMKTDAEIQNIKKNSEIENYVNKDKFSILSDRRKRSINKSNKKYIRSDTRMMLPEYPPGNSFDSSRFNLYFPPFNQFSTTAKESKKIKRYVNMTEEPTGYVIEKKQIIVQYKPDSLKKVPKCSHSPKESIQYKSHEKQLKHPFYKNTQRLDELLDHLLDKNLPELMADPFGVDVLLKNNKLVTEKEMYPIDFLGMKMKENIKDADNSFLDIVTSSSENSHVFEFTTPKTTKKRLKSTTTSPYYNVLLSVATLVNPARGRGAKKQTPGNSRKLLQVNEEDDEGLGYEDVNEVLTDDSESQEEKEEGQERKKRMEDYPAPPNLPTQPSLDLHNPNWKGPMPLYPDELVSMVKQAAMKNIHNLYQLNKVKLPDSKDVAEMDDNMESNLNEMEYLENYSDKKSEGLVKMAQAYSDYGVFDGKKGSMGTEKNRVTAKLENSKKSLKKKKKKKKRKSGKRAFFDRSRKSVSESYQYDASPTQRSEDEVIDIFKALGKHVKFGVAVPDSNFKSAATGGTVGIKLPELSLFSTVPAAKLEASRNNHYKKVDDDNSIAVQITRARSRRLLSIHGTDDIDSGVKLNNKTDESNVTDESEQTLLHAVLDVNNSNLKNNTQNMDISDVFAMISSWFSALAASAFQSNNKSLENNSKVVDLNTEKRTSGPIDKSNDVKNIKYDSEITENIGHRSRVLMSVEDTKQETGTYSNITPRSDNAVSNGKPDHEEQTKLTTLLSTKDKTTNISSTVSFVVTTNKAATNYKTIVKRNSNECSNLIFWNDIYDDEYGVKLDPLESTIRDKQSNARGMDFVKKSGDWIHDKVKNLASNMRGGKSINKKGISSPSKSTCGRVVRSAKYYRNGVYPKPNKTYKHRKRNINPEDEVGEIDHNFDVLTKKMKAVCKEAAQAVQQTRNIKATRQSEREDVLSASLMQQLVRLMTDVIDYQVHQKTCLRLPPDLQEFLDWITSAETNQGEGELRSSRMEIRDEDIDTPHKPSPTSEREDIHPETRSDCLGTIHAVEDLMQEYDEMSDDDKLKMTGVRQYLENQLEFLHKHLANSDDYKMPTYYQSTDVPFRFKRYVTSTRRSNKNRCKTKSFQQKQRYKRKFLKNFSKRRTRTTASIYDGGYVTELYKPTRKPVTADRKDNDKLDSNDANKDTNTEKRNLKDVYYKAVADAKKIKIVHKKAEIDGFDKAKVLRIDK